MQKTIYSWLGREFVSLCGEARPLSSVAEQTDDIFRRFEVELSDCGLSLDNTVRTRIWGRDREARTLGTVARAKILTGRNRAASSSYISAGHFNSQSRVALDLLAMRPLQARVEREPVDFTPPRNYLSHLRYDSIVFVSGFTAQATRMDEQVAAVIRDLDNTLRNASSGWAQVVKVSVFLDRTQDVKRLKSLLGDSHTADLAKTEFSFVDGFSSEQSLLEIEVTALVGA
jgi:enamine deaminase RidA (YjgF/YER057c/UK114 family)